MSPIGRIFVVINLILSAAFLGWASAALNSGVNYRQQLTDAGEKHKTELAGKDKEIESFQIENNSLSDAQRQFREERDAAKTDVERLTTQLDELKRANAKMLGNLTEIQAALTDYNATIAQLSQQKDAAIEQAHEAERARDQALQEKQDAEIAMRDAEEAANNARLAIQDLEKERTSLTEAASQLEARLITMSTVTGTSLDTVMSQPKIEAAVMSVNPDLKMVVLNKGSDDGVLAGFTFDIYRGSQYKGRVRVLTPQKEVSSAQIILVNPGTKAITQGDSATTSL